jgi:hypothetical protein
MPRLALLALCLPLAAAPPALLLIAPALRAQVAVTAWPVPAPSDVSSGPTTLCTAHGPERLCRAPGDERGFVFTLERYGREARRWNADGWLDTGFRVFDLPGDSMRLVANLDAVSSGLGVHYWTLYLFAETPEGWRPTGTVPIPEFGPEGGSFAEDGGTVLWATEWLQGPDPRGRRGEGLYFVGRPFRLEGGRLVPAADLPVRARRFLNSFAEERYDDAPATPAAWLSDRRAETRRTDPYLLDGETASVRGTVEAVTPQPAEEGTTNWVVRIRPAQGEPVVYTYAFGYGEHAGPPFRYVGDAASGRLFPPGYLQADPAAWLVGRRVRAATYADAHEPRVVLWLE